MKKILIILLLLTNNVFSQICPNVVINGGTVVNCTSPCTNLTANYTQIKSTTTYTVSNILFAPFAYGPQLPTTINMNDDSQSGPFQIGFNFCFFGNNYSQFYIGSNGWISFSSGQPTTFTSTPIPSLAATVPKNSIMGPWQDWHPGLGGQISYQMQGTAPCRRLVVTWSNIPMYQCTNIFGSFQIVIYETTNVIENHISFKPNCLSWANGTAVQGIHNLNGTLAFTVPGRNSTQWTTISDSWRWTPNGLQVPTTVNWFNLNTTPPTLVGSGQTINLCPTVSTNYSAQVSYTNCNGNIIVISDTTFIDCQTIPLNTSTITHN